jgi:hypothetical protein
VGEKRCTPCALASFDNAWSADMNRRKKTCAVTTHDTCIVALRILDHCVYTTYIRASIDTATSDLSNAAAINMSHGTTTNAYVALLAFEYGVHVVLRGAACLATAPRPAYRYHARLASVTSMRLNVLGTYNSLGDTPWKINIHFDLQTTHEHDSC